jgi:exonuclease III
VPKTEHLETLGVQLQLPCAPLIDFILIYRSPSISRSALLADLEILMQADERSTHSMILGDFNLDAFGQVNQDLEYLMEKYSYKLSEAKTTHKLGSCLDHLYLSKDMQKQYSNCTYLPTYFSDHHYVIMQLEKPQ